MSDLVKLSTVATTAAILAEPGTLHGAVLTAGSDAATLIVYDNTNAATGTVLVKLGAAATTSVCWSPDWAVSARVGVYAAVTGTGPSATVYFKP